MPYAPGMRQSVPKGLAVARRAPGPPITCRPSDSQTDYHLDASADASPCAQDMHQSVPGDPADVHRAPEPPAARMPRDHGTAALPTWPLPRLPWGQQKQLMYNDNSVLNGIVCIMGPQRRQPGPCRDFPGTNKTNNNYDYTIRCILCKGTAAPPVWPLLRLP